MMADPGALNHSGTVLSGAMYDKGVGLPHCVAEEGTSIWQPLQGHTSLLLMKWPLTQPHLWKIPQPLSIQTKETSSYLSGEYAVHI